MDARSKPCCSLPRGFAPEVCPGGLPRRFAPEVCPGGLPRRFALEVCPVRFAGPVAFIPDDDGRTGHHRYGRTTGLIFPQGSSRDDVGYLRRGGVREVADQASLMRLCADIPDLIVAFELTSSPGGCQSVELQVFDRVRMTRKMDDFEPHTAKCSWRTMCSAS